ncbi:hypothetical protein D3C80_1276240 [compost metagenome]
MPKPARNLKVPNSVGVVANAPKKVKPLKMAIQIMMVFLRPSLSESVPKLMAPNIMPNNAVLASNPACTVVNAHSCMRIGKTTP